MSALLHPGEPQGPWEMIGDLRRRVGSLEATPAGSIIEITSDDASVTITNPNGPIVDLSVTGGGGTSGIFFDTDPQAGNWLFVETTSSHTHSGLLSPGIGFKTAYGTTIITDGSVNHAEALTVRNILGAETDTIAILAEAQSTYNGGVGNALVKGLRATADMVHGGAYGVEAQASGNGSGSAGSDVYGVIADGISLGAANCYGVRGAATPNSATCDYGIGIRGFSKVVAADQVAGVGGQFEVYNGVTQISTAASQLAHAEPGTSVYALARSNALDVAGVVIDVDSVSGSPYPIRAYVAGAEVFRVDPNGDIHISTGASVIADL